MRRIPVDAASKRGEVPLTAVEFHVLLSLADASLHGYAIIQQVLERTDGALRLRTGTLYTVVKRLLDLGWIEETEPAPRDVADGRDDERRRYYRLTRVGRGAVQAEAKRLESLVAVARQKRVLGPARRLAPERGR
jgi:DNA-binding PadR family transcriptional regulator